MRTWNDFKRLIAIDIKVSKVRAGAILKLVFEEITKALMETGGFRIPEFGTFKLVKKPPKSFRNPQTGQMQKEIKAKKTIIFKVSGILKDRLNS